MWLYITIIYYNKNTAQLIEIPHTNLNRFSHHKPTSELIGGPNRVYFKDWHTALYIHMYTYCYT